MEALLRIRLSNESMQNSAPQSTTTDLAISVAWKTAAIVLPIAGVV